jgi:thymidine kinase
MKGSIKLILGGMFASKTSTMCNDVERYRIANKLCVIVKFSNDTRYNHLAKNGGIVTHAGFEHCKCPVIPARTLTEVFDEISEYEVIGIDETQFFPDCVEIVQKLANMCKIMICAGLDGDCKQK